MKSVNNKKDETNMFNSSAAVLIPLLVLTFMRYTLSFLFLFKLKKKKTLTMADMKILCPDRPSGKDFLPGSGEYS